MEIFKYNRRNILVLVVVLVLTAVLFFAWYCYKGLTGTSGDRGNIPYPAVRSTGSIFKPLARKSVQSIVDITLDNTGYIRWKACTGELDVLIEEADLLLGKADEVLVALSLSPQEGLVACYTREGGRLNYVGKIPNLLPVTGIWTLGNTRLENRLLIVEQVQDEMLGAFFNARYSDVFLPGDGHFDRVLGLLTNYNAYWNRAWDGVKEDASWLWLNQSAKVEYRTPARPFGLITSRRCWNQWLPIPTVFRRRKALQQGISGWLRKNTNGAVTGAFISLGSIPTARPEKG